MTKKESIKEDSTHKKTAQSDEGSNTEMVIKDYGELGQIKVINLEDLLEIERARKSEPLSMRK